MRWPRRSITLAAVQTATAGGAMGAETFVDQFGGNLVGTRSTIGKWRAGRGRLSSDTSSGVEVGVLDGYSAVVGSGAAIRIVFDDRRLGVGARHVADARAWLKDHRGARGGLGPVDRCFVSARSSSASTTSPPDRVLVGCARLRAARGASTTTSPCCDRGTASVPTSRSTGSIDPTVRRASISTCTRTIRPPRSAPERLGATRGALGQAAGRRRLRDPADPEGNRFCVIDSG